LSIKLVFLATLLSLESVSGQSQDSATSAKLAGPVLGFVFDSAVHGLRPILGVPGAGVLKPPLDLGFSLADAVVSPQQDYVLALTGDTHDVRVLRIANGTISVSPIDGAPAQPDRMFLSPTGTAAALYYERAAVIRILAGLPNAPVAGRTLDVSNLGGTAGTLAVSDDGELVLATVAQGGSGALLLLGPDGGPAQLPVAGPVTALAFRPQSHDALAAGNNQLSLIRSIDRDPQYLVLATQNDGIAGPVSIQFSSDGARVFVANSDTASIAMLESGGGPVSLISCEGGLSGLNRLSGTSVFRLNEPSGQPLLLLDGSAARPRILFVPSDEALHGGNQ